MTVRKQQQATSQGLFKLDPSLVRISEEEIRADLLYRGEERARPSDQRLDERL
jgi:hypothetical protein